MQVTNICVPRIKPALANITLRDIFLQCSMSVHLHHSSPTALNVVHLQIPLLRHLGCRPSTRLMITTALGHTAESVAGSWKSANHFLCVSASFLLLCFVSQPLTKLAHKIPSPRQRRLDSIFPSHWFIHLPRLRPSASEYIRGTTVPKTWLQPLCHVR